MSNWMEVDGSKVIGFPWVISPTDKWGIPWGEITHGDPITIDPLTRNRPIGHPSVRLEETCQLGPGVTDRTQVSRCMVFVSSTIPTQDHEPGL